MAACRVLDDSGPLSLGRGPGRGCPTNEAPSAQNPRADGMRVKKTDTWTSPTEVTKYFYDGQMGVEDVWDDGTDELVTRYGIGARGIEVISKIENGGSETFGFPVYDTHGNMLATLGRSGSSYTTGNWQTYDVWGSVRSGSSSEEQGYVADLGHRADPESFLTYMRARYYEPHTGRFISQDLSRDGSNWYVYATNCPTSKVDESGNSAKWSAAWYWFGLAFATMSFLSALSSSPPMVIAAGVFAIMAVTAFSLSLGSSIADSNAGPDAKELLNAGLAGMTAAFVGLIGYIVGLVRKSHYLTASRAYAAAIVGITFTYALMILGAILNIDN